MTVAGLALHLVSFIASNFIPDSALTGLKLTRECFATLSSWVHSTDSSRHPQPVAHSRAPLRDLCATPNLLHWVRLRWAKIELRETLARAAVLPTIVPCLTPAPSSFCSDAARPSPALLDLFLVPWLAWLEAGCGRSAPRSSTVSASHLGRSRCSGASALWHWRASCPF